MAPALPPLESATSAPRAHDFSAGDLLNDRYRLLNLLGEGGMGQVWRAHSLALRRDVAVKLIRRDRESAEAVARLHLEARAAGGLEHPSIVRVFDFGETAAGDPFLVMELLQGESLADLIDHRGPMSEPRAVALMIPLASALQAAHARGIVHRDIKPDNVFVVPLDRDEGTRLPKIVDFGLARLQASQRRLTAEGSVLGSPGYMAPEQAMGEPDVDAQADVWGFCVVLYELITGLVPFSGANVGQTIAAIIQQEPRSTTDLVGGDPDLWAILRRGLAKPREDRWPSMVELRDALIAWALAHGVSADISGAPLAPARRSDPPPPIPRATRRLPDTPTLREAIAPVEVELREAAAPEVAAASAHATTAASATTAEHPTPAALVAPTLATAATPTMAAVAPAASTPTMAVAPPAASTPTMAVVSPAASTPTMAAASPGAAAPALTTVSPVAAASAPTAVSPAPAAAPAPTAASPAPAAAPVTTMLSLVTAAPRSPALIVVAVIAVAVLVALGVRQVIRGDRADAPGPSSGAALP